VSQKQDVERARIWQKAIREAARSGMSIREFCRQRKLHESQFYCFRPANPCAGGPGSAGFIPSSSGRVPSGVETK
jgi:hypothetical protein